MTFVVASFPGHAQLSVACSAVKWESAYHVSDVKGRKTAERLGMNLGILGLRTARKAKEPSNIPCISS